MTLWHRTVTRFAARLREKYGPIDRVTAVGMARLLSASLVPRRSPGRKPTPPVLTALQLSEQGVPWVRIYRCAIPAGRLRVSLASPPGGFWIFGQV